MKKIFMLCPAYYKSGGPELAHQLVHELLSLGYDAYIYYVNMEKNRLDPTNPEFKKYNIKYVTNIENDNNCNNLLIVPETFTKYLYKYSKIKKAIWWMSVDNYFKYVPKCYNKNNFVNVLKKIKNKIFSNKIYLFEDNNSIIHFYQSKYASVFLESKGIKNKYYLSDYIGETYLNAKFNIDTKKDIILYNPKKGFDFTEKIINNTKNVEFVPIQNLTENQVKKILLKSKIYIDFGNHPGKDRFPREAVMCGCCIITGKKGSAKYKEDVYIDSEFKFQDIDSNVDKISKKIISLLKNYKTEYKKFDKYRNKTLKEPLEFKNNVKYVFNKIGF